MPISSPYSIGGNLAVKGKTTLVGTMVAGAGATSPSRALQVEGIPHIVARLVQTSNTGVGLGATINLQGMVRITTTGTQKWETYQTFVMPAGGVVTLPFSPATFTFPFSKVRLQMVAAAAAVGDTTIDFVLAATD